MDISAETGDETFFEHTPHFDWLTAHAHEFGFIRRYQQFKEKFTGVLYEPHHYRYVGREVARALHDGGLSLEEYCAGEVNQPARQQSDNAAYDPREIYLAKSPINYLVVRAREDDYYLRHNFSGEESIHGAI